MEKSHSWNIVYFFASITTKNAVTYFCSADTTVPIFTPHFFSGRITVQLGLHFDWFGIQLNKWKIEFDFYIAESTGSKRGKPETSWTFLGTVSVLWLSNLKRPLFFNFVFSIHFLIKLIVNKIADDWLWTADLWCWKQPLSQLRHNHSPTLNVFTHLDPKNQLLFCQFFGLSCRLFWVFFDEKTF